MSYIDGSDFGTKIGYRSMTHRLGILEKFGLVFFIIYMLWPPTTQGADGRFKNAVIQVESGLLTVTVKDMPLFNILGELADQTGIVFEVYADAGRKITASYVKIPIEEGLKRLLSPSNYIIEYTAKNAPSKKAEIKKIIVYGRFASVNGQRTVMQTPGDVGNESQKTGRRPYKKPEKSGAAISLEAYAEQLNDADPDTREEAVSDMADEYGEAALEHLEKALVHDGNDDVRAAAAEEIGDIESERGIEVLAKALNDPDEDVKEAVIEALGEIGGEKALPVLRKALKDRNEDIREAAAELIEEIEEEIKEK